MTIHNHESIKFQKWFDDYMIGLDDVSSLQSVALDAWMACKMEILEIVKYADREDFELGRMRKEIERC